MKSTYGRNFITVAMILLLALTVLGVSFQMLVKNYLTQNALTGLRTDAEAIAKLTAAWSTDTGLSRRGLLLNLDVASQMSDADVVICDREGRVVLCSDGLMGCEHQGMILNRSYLERVLTYGAQSDTGVIQGLYADRRFIVSVPIVSGTDSIGIVLVSSPTQAIDQIQGKLSNMFLTAAAFVVLAAVIAVGVYTRKESKPLRDMARAANAFGHGDLEARVPVDEDASEEMAELTLAFNNMASSLQKSEYQRQEFVANVSHELKTPMTTISGYVDGILDGTIPPQRHQQYLRIVSDETKRLSRLVRSMLDISQLQAEGGIPEEKKMHFDLEEVLGSVLITFEKKINDKGLDVEVDMPDHPVYTFANRDYITQVIYNLLDNAVKFCPQGKTLGLKIAMAGSKAYISVANEGDTIPPEELSLLFDRFHKLDKSRSQNRDGWGLGLYIVKTIVCSHGENISVSSKNGRTEFTFTMPLVN